MQVGRTLWGLCNTLRHDGIDYGQYLDQLTYLLFLKMAKEQAVSVPSGCDWESIQATADDQLLEKYESVLTALSMSPGLVGDIYTGATSAFSNFDSLRTVISVLNSVNWASLGRDVQAEAFEYLLEQAAAEGKKGAGQYFTPRALTQLIVDCVQPGSQARDRVISDPALGTAGFLISAVHWAREHSDSGAVHLRVQGNELVARARRLGVMNLLLHGIDDPQIVLGDALISTPGLPFSDVVVTNPPFGSKGGKPPEREDFWIRTTNKQLNFIQHVIGNLAPGGRAAMVLPDNCFFGEAARQLWPVLTEQCDVHTLLRLPDGSFAPYTSGTRTNVLFFTKGTRTSSTWIFDARTGHKRSSKLATELSPALAGFRECFGEDPLGGSRRKETDDPLGRWKEFSRHELAAADFQIDSFSWLPLSEGQSTDGLVSVQKQLDEVERDLTTFTNQLQSLIRSLRSHD